MEPLRRVAIDKDLARPVPALAMAHHSEKVVGREAAPDEDEDEQTGGHHLAGILSPAHHPQNRDATPSALMQLRCRWSTNCRNYLAAARKQGCVRGYSDMRLESYEAAWSEEYEGGR